MLSECLLLTSALRDLISCNTKHISVCVCVGMYVFMCMSPVSAHITVLIVSGEVIPVVAFPCLFISHISQFLAAHYN